VSNNYIVNIVCFDTLEHSLDPAQTCQRECCVEAMMIGEDIKDIKFNYIINNFSAVGRRMKNEGETLSYFVLIL
jgi:hypothetical protein